MVRSSPILRGVIYAHNGYLELLAGVGLFGFLAWAGMIFAGLRGCFRSFRGRWPGETVPMNNLAFYMLVALISALINNLFDSAEFNYFLWVPLAGGLAVGNIQRRRVDPSNR
jgi:O-antigen ligase